jgi:hypothetical protein
MNSDSWWLRTIIKLRDRILGIEKLRKEIQGILWEINGVELSHLSSCRDEILLEMRYGTTDKKTTDTRIVNRQKFDLLLEKNQIILNVGSGTNISDQMLNIDMRELPGVDIVADAGDIQLPKEIAKEVYSSHVLEHFPHEKLRRSVLPNWVALLQVGGDFRAIVPDAEAMMTACINGTMSFEDLRTVTFGLQEYEGDTHYTMFSRESLKLLLEEAGLRGVTYVATARPNGLCLEMEVLAYK